MWGGPGTTEWDDWEAGSGRERRKETKRGMREDGENGYMRRRRENGDGGMSRKKIIVYRE